MAAMGSCARPEECDPESPRKNPDLVAMLKSAEEAFMEACVQCASDKDCEEERDEDPERPRAVRLQRLLREEHQAGRQEGHGEEARRAGQAPCDLFDARDSDQVNAAGAELNAPGASGVPPASAGCPDSPGRAAAPRGTPPRPPGRRPSLARKMPRFHQTATFDGIELRGPLEGPATPRGTAPSTGRGPPGFRWRRGSRLPSPGPPRRRRWPRGARPRSISTSPRLSQLVAIGRVDPDGGLEAPRRASASRFTSR